jgi:hypothetical protein
MAREKLGEILIKAGVLDQVGLQRALNEQARWGGQLGRYLVELGLITEETLVRALSTQYRLPAVALDPPKLNISVGRLVPKEICERNNLVCFRADLKNKFLDIAMSDPSNADAIDEIRVATKFNVRPHIAAPTVVDKAISYIFYGDMALGGDLDLGPDSSLRVDPQTSELVRSAQRSGPARPEPPAPPAPAPPPALTLNVTTSPSAPPPPMAAAPPPVPVPAPLPPLAATASYPSAGPWTPGVTPLGGGGLEVQVTTSSGPDVAASSKPTAASLAAVKLPPTPRPGDDGFHITMDVPVVDKASLTQPSPFEEKLAAFEATLARNSAILQALLEGMLRRGMLSHEEILRIITGKY